MGVEPLEPRVMLSATSVLDTTSDISVVVADDTPPIDITPVLLRPSYVLAQAEGTPEQFIVTTQYDDAGTPRALIQLRPDLATVDMSLQRLTLELRLGTTVLERQEVLIDIAEPEFLTRFLTDRVADAEANTADLSLEEHAAIIDSLGTPVSVMPDSPAGGLSGAESTPESTLSGLTSLAEEQATETVALTTDQKLAFYDALQTTAQTIEAQIVPGTSDDAEAQAVQKESLGRATLLLAAQIRTDLSSTDPAVASAASALRDQLLSLVDIRYTLFTGLGRNQDVRRDVASDGTQEFVLGFMEEAVYEVLPSLTVDLGGQSAMVQVRRQSFSKSAWSGALLSNGIPLSADTWVGSGSPSAAHGTASVLHVESGDEAAESYLRFDVSSYVGQIVPNADIALQTVSASGTGQNSISAYRDLFGFTTGADWDEATLAWDGLSDFSQGFSNPLATWTPVAGETVHADVSEAVQRALLAGDSNRSGALDRSDFTNHASDIDAFYWALRDPAYYESHFGSSQLSTNDTLYRNDINWDGEVTIDDAAWMLQRHGVAAGNFNLDNVVDGNDYSVWSAHYGVTTTPSTGGYTAGDANFDGAVGDDDYLIFLDAIQNEATNVAPKSAQLTFRIAPASPAVAGIAEYVSDDASTDTAPRLETMHEFVVNSLGDQSDAVPGDGVVDTDPATTVQEVTLRAAIEEANVQQSQSTWPGIYRITFDPLLSGTISLGGLGQLDIVHDLEIVGPGSDRLTIDAHGASRVLQVESGATVELSGVSLTGGGSVDVGAGIYNAGGDLTLSAVRVVNNTTRRLAATGNDNGGGIYSENGSLHVANSTVDGNQARWNAGISFLADDAADVLEISGSTISHNVALDLSNAGSGGGLGVKSSSTGAALTVVNSTFSGNAAGYVGAIYVSQSSHLSIINSTITDNSSSTTIGGIFLAEADVQVKLYNSIIAGNSDQGGSGGQRDVARWLGTFDGTSSNNIIGVVGWSGLSTTANQTGTESAPRNPGLTPLGDFGGTTLTHALLPTSTAIDAGSNARAVAANGSPLLVDQRGATRIMDVGASGPTGNTVDIGALECSIPTALVVSTTDDLIDGRYDSGQLSLREALALAAAIPGTDTITFTANLTNQQIRLTQGQLVIDSAVDLVGPGMEALRIDGDGNSRVFQVNGNVDATIRGLTIAGGNSSEGSGVYTFGNLTLDSVRVADNSTTGYGGGIYVYGTLTLDSSLVEGNTSASVGGGIYVNDTGYATIRQSTIDNNQAYYGAGIYGYLQSGDRLIIDSSTISHNRAIGTWAVGGAMYVWSASSTANSVVTIVNSTISSNTASYSGGLRLDGSHTHLNATNTTIAYNQGNEGGGLQLTSGATATIHNTIVAENKNAAGTSDTDVWGSLDSVSSYNLLGRGGSGGLTNGGTYQNTVLYSWQNAGLAPLDNYGGPTKTHALVPDSLAIDRGGNAKAVGPNGALTVDQRGLARTIDVGTTGPTGRTVDIGAFEFSFTTPLVVSTTADTVDGRYGSGELSLREALLLANLTPGTDTISFDPQLYATGPATITLAYDGSDAGVVPDPLYAYNVTIQGPGADKLILSGGGQTQVLNLWNVTIDGVTITGGSAAYGGGIYAAESTIRNSRITGNSATSSGGGIYSYGSLQLIGSEVSNNTAAIAGGGVWNQRYSNDYGLTIVNSTISGNSVTGASGQGGGLVLSLYNGNYGSAGATISNSTISGNSANSGGGIFTQQTYGTTQKAKLFNTIVAGNLNLASAANDIAGNGLDASSAYNLIGSGGSGGLVNGGSQHNIVLNSGQSAGLAPLDFYGGTTRSQGLLPDSLAIDAGDPNFNASSFTPALTADQRGTYFERVVAGRIDIGATEAHVARRADGTIDVYGTPQDDVISVANSDITLDRIGTVTVDVSSAPRVTVYALAGNDTVAADPAVNTPLWAYGGDGSDHLTGGAGDDRLESGAGDDTLIGGLGNNTLYGGSGSSTLVAGSGTNTLYGGTGNTTFLAGSGSGFFHGGTGSNTYVFDPSQGALGHNTIYTAATAPNDTLDFSAFGSTQPVTIDLAVTTEQTISASTLWLTLSSGTGISNVIGGAGNDTLTGNSRNNTLSGRGGDNTLSGVAGNNMLVAGTGSDTLLAGSGNDELLGGGSATTFITGSGDATFVGGTGDNTYVFDPSRGTLQGIAVVTNPGAANDTLDFSAFSASQPVTIDISSVATQFASSAFTSFSLTLSDATGISKVVGGVGNDTITGNSRNNLLDGGLGTNTLYGGSGNSTLVAGGGTNTLYGGSGNTTFVAGSGSGFFHGGTGSNTYIFDPSEGALGHNMIYTDAAAPNDTLDFSAFGSSQPVTIDLAVTTEQTISPSTLWLTLSSSTGISNVIGGAGNDTITGNSRDNRLVGNAGNDVLDGCAQQTNFSFVTGLGGDQLLGGEGSDHLIGDAPDRVFVEDAAGPEEYNGQMGYWMALPVNDLLDAGNGDDLIDATTGSNIVMLRSGNNTVYGGRGNNTYVFDADSQGNQTIHESTDHGVNTLDLSAITSPITLDLDNPLSQVITTGLAIAMPELGIGQVLSGSEDNDITGTGTGSSSGSGSSGGSQSGSTYTVTLNSGDDVATIAPRLNSNGQYQASVTVSGLQGTSIYAISPGVSQLVIQADGSNYSHRVVLESLTSSITLTVLGGSSTNDALVILGTNSNDNFVLSSSGAGFSLSNGTSGNVVTFSGVEYVTTDGLGQDLTISVSTYDSLTLQTTASNWVLTGNEFSQPSQSTYPKIRVQNIERASITGAGNTTIYADAPGTTASTLNSIAINGAGTSYTVSVVGTSGPDSIDVSGTSITVNGGPSIKLTNIGLSIAAGDGDDTIRIPSWAGATAIVINAGAGVDTVDASGSNSAVAASTTAGMLNVESLNLSHVGLTTLSSLVLPSSLVSLDLRYNSLPLNVSTTLASLPLSLSNLYLYGNSGTTELTPGPPDLQALAGRLVRVDLAPIGLDKAEQLWDPNGNVKTLDQIETEIVKALHYLPLEIFDYVHNNYEFQAYRGAMKGSLGVILTHAGNDYEQAQLLKELFQKAGISSTLKQADIPLANFTTSDLAQWLGVRTGAALSKVLGASGLVFGSSSNLLRRTWLEENGMYFDPAWKFKAYTAPDADFLALPLNSGATSVGDKVRQVLNLDFTDPANNLFYASVSKQVGYEWFQDRVAEYLSQYGNGLSLADLSYDGPIKPLLTTTSTLDKAFAINLSGVGVVSAGANENWRVVIDVEYKTGASTWNPIFTEQVLSVPAYSLTPIILTWDSGTRTPSLSKLDLANNSTGTLTSFNLTAATFTSDTIRMTVGFIKPGESSYQGGDSLTKKVSYERPVGVNMALGLEANQLNDEFIAGLQNVNNYLAIVNGYNAPSGFGPTKSADLLALAVNKFFRRTDQGQDALDSLFHTVQVRNDVAAGFASSTAKIDNDSTTYADFRPDLQLPYLPKNLFVDIKQFRAGAYSIDTTSTSGYDSAESARFNLAFASSSSQESGIWEELANNDAMSTVKSFQMARSASPTNAIVTLTSAGQVGSLTGLAPEARNAITAAFTNAGNPAVKVITPSRSTDLKGWAGVGFLAIYADGSQGWIIQGGNTSSGAGGYATSGGYTPFTPITNTWASTTSFGDPINAATGAVVEDVTDINITTKGLPLTFARHYDSFTSGDGTLGKGWWGTYSDRITVSGTTVIWTDSRGNQLTFTENASTADLYDYKNPESIFGEFRKSTDGTTYRFRFKDGILYTFKSPTAGTADAGTLVEIRDPHNNYITIQHDTLGRTQQVDSKNRDDGTTMSLRFVYNSASTVQISTLGLPGGGNDRFWTYKLQAGTPVTFSGTVTAASKTINTTNTTLRVGMAVSGTNIPTGAIITSVIPGTSIQISKAATGTGSSFTATPYQLIEAEYPHTMSDATIADGTIEAKATKTTLVYKYGYNANDNMPTSYLLKTISTVARTYTTGTAFNDSAATSTIKHTYYANGRGFQTTDAGGFVQTYQYNTYRNETTFTDEAGNNTRYFYDDKGRQVRVVWADGSIETDEWGAGANAGLHTSHTDAFGVITKYTYGANASDLNRVLGNATIVSQNKYDSFGVGGGPIQHWTNISVSDRDAYGNLVTTYPTTTYTYDNRFDANGLVFSKTQTSSPLSAIAGSRDVTYTYTPTGDLERVQQTYWDPATGVLNTPNTSYRYYTQAGLLQYAIDPRGSNSLGNYTTTYGGFDSFGHATSVQHWISTGVWATESFVYGDHGYLISFTDDNHHTTNYTSDIFGRRLTTTQPADLNGHRPVYTNTYDERGNPLSTALAQPNEKTTFAYNSRQELVRTIYGDGNAGPRATDVFNAVGNVVAQSDGNGNVTSFQFDRRNRAVETILPDGSFTATRYDARGNVISQMDARGNTTYFSYDQLGRLVQKKDPAANEVRTISNVIVVNNSPTAAVWTYQYDVVGNKLTESVLGRQTNYYYDSLGRLIRRIDPDPDPQTGGGIGNNSPVTTYAYDRAGNLTSMAIRQNVGGPPQQLTTNEYDGLNRLVTTTAADGGVTIYRYDGVGNLKEVVDPQGSATFNPAAHTTKYTYDNLNRLVEELNPAPGTGDPTPHIYYQYDLAGNLLTQTLTEDAAVSPTKRVTNYVYDNMNRPIQVTQTDGTNALSRSTSKYDDAGNLIKTTVSAAVVWTDIANMARVETTRYEYDNRNRRTHTIDALGGTSYVAYDQNGNVVGEQDAAGNVTNHVYNALNQEFVTIYPSPSGATTLSDNPVKIMLHDSAGDVVTTKFETVTKLLASSTLIRQTDYVYDKLHRIIKTILPPDQDGSRAAITDTYDVLGNKQTETTARKVNSSWAFVAGDTTPVLVTTYSYDGLNRLTDVAEHDLAQGASTTLDRKHHYEYDKNGNLVLEALYGPDGSTTTLPLLSKTETIYDALNRPTRENHYWITQGATTSSTIYNYAESHYDVAGNLVKYTADHNNSTAGRVTTYDYDGLNRQTEEKHYDLVTPTLVISRHTVLYDSVGNLARTQVVFNGVLDGADASKDRTTKYSYDLLNRPTIVVDPLGHANTTAYDALGNVVNVSDAMGNKTTYQFDRLSRQTRVIDPRGSASTTITTYDEAGNVLTIRDPNSNVVTYSYDQRDRTTKEQKSGIPIDEVYVYDQRGDLTQKTDHLNYVTTYSYDAFGRQLMEKWMNGATPLETITFSYFGDDQISQATDVKTFGPIANVSYVYTYADALRRQKTAVQSFNGSTSATQTNTYDERNDRTTENIASGTSSYNIGYQYDGLGREKQVSQSGGSVTAESATFTYNAAGELATILRFNSSNGSTNPVDASTYAYDNAGRLTSLAHTINTTTNRGKYTYDYDAADRIIRKTYLEPGQTVREENTFGYDVADQLTAASLTNESYTYDANGNRIGGSKTNDLWNRYTFDGTYVYKYDTAGNRYLKRQDGVSVPQTRYTYYGYDSRDRLLYVSEFDPALQSRKHSEYVYDAFDRRVGKWVDPDGDAGPAAATLETYFYDGDELRLARSGVTGATTHRYLDGPLVDQVLADEEAAISGGAGTSRWLLADEQESIRAITQASGSTTSVVDNISYDSFGKATETFTGAEFSHLHGYTGQVYDKETGLGYYKARYYDPVAGRFLTEDPSREGSNWTLYVGNNPINNTDPTGLSATNPFSSFGSSYSNYGLSSFDISPSPAAMLGNINQLLSPTPMAGNWFGSGLSALNPFSSFGSSYSNYGMSSYDISSNLFGSNYSSMGLGSTDLAAANLDTNVSEIRAWNPPWYERAWLAVSPYIFPTGINHPVEDFEMNVVTPAIVAGGKNSARFAQGSVRSLGGGLGTVVTGAGDLVGVPYAEEAFNASSELARRGVSDMGASLGFGGNQWGATLAYGNIAPSSAAQFMAQTRNQPGVSPTVRLLSQGSEIVGDVSWAAAQGLQGTKLGSMDLRLPGTDVAPSATGPTRVTQYFVPSKGPFPVEGRYALSSDATLGNRLVDGITETTTWVAPRPASGMTQWSRTMTGVGNRTHWVEFDVFPGELQSPGGLKSLFGNYQQVIPGRVDLLGRNPIYGTSGFNYIDAGVRYGVPAAAVGSGTYLIYRGATGNGE